MDFGERLKNLRIERGLTQEDVAYAMNVTKQAVSKWENGLSLPDVASLGNLANLLGVNVDYLLTGNDNVKIEKEIEIVEKEVIKEKIVEVDEPLSEALLEGLLRGYQRLCVAYYGGISIGIFFIIAGCMVVAKIIKQIHDFTSTDILLLVLTLCIALSGIISLILGIKSRKKYLKQKKEIEEKTGKEITYFGYKEDK